MKVKNLSKTTAILQLIKIGYIHTLLHPQLPNKVYYLVS